MKDDIASKLKVETERRERAEKRMLYAEARLDLRRRGWSDMDAQVGAAWLSEKGHLALDDAGKAVFREEGGYERPFERGLAGWAGSEIGQKLQLDRAFQERKAKKTGGAAERSGPYTDTQFGADLARDLLGSDGE